MKIVNKLIPLTALAAVATVPVVATSCSKVWTDVLSSQYTPSFNPLESGEMTSYEATDSYFSYFKEKQGLLIEDSYWSCSVFARETIKELYGVDVQTYLAHIYSFVHSNNDGKDTISYTFEVQIQIKEPGEEQSYSIKTYDLYWEISNLEFYVINTGTTGSDINCWTLCPAKFDFNRGVWFEELKGSERVKFDFKTVIKGYSNTGAQNFVREVNESAVIDEEHKYAPELNEIFTDTLIFDTYYLKNQKPRMSITNSTVASSTTERTGNLKFNFGDATKQKFSGNTVKLSIIGDPVVVSNVDFKVKQINIDPTITVGSTTQTPSFTVVKTDDSPDPIIGDKVYFTVHAECGNDWEEDFYINVLFY